MVVGVKTTIGDNSRTPYTSQSDETDQIVAKAATAAIRFDIHTKYKMRFNNYKPPAMQ